AAALPRVAPESLAAIVWTSGSTAAPKGALHLHETLVAELSSLVDAHALGPGDRVLMPSPLGHVSGIVHGILGPAILGTSAVLLERWDAGAGLREIERRRATYMVGAPTFLQEMLAHPEVERRDLSSLRLFSCGGASVPPELLHRAGERLPSMVAKRVYGSSEFPTIATTTAADAAERGRDTEGRALTGVEIRVCDEAGRALPPGSEGEIRARGPECFLGWVDASLDAETFDGDDFLLTGDLGVLDADGYLRVTGRLKDIVVRKGEKISAREVEDLLAGWPGLVEAAIVPVSDPETGERACACLLLRDGAPQPTLDDVVSFLRGARLAAQKLPERLLILDSFPRTPSGKVNKRLLREIAEAGPGAA
ncbi:MAG: AMP-binding protein, partial [Alphaproteobacteria bacterium]